MAIPHHASKSPGPPSYLDEEFDGFMKRVMEECHIPGAGIAIVQGDEIESKGYGVTFEGGPAITSDTLFNAASMSKSFTAAAIGLLVDDKNYPQVTWDTPVSSLMREDFVLSDTYATEHVTVVDMLSHRTGYYGHDAANVGLKAKVPDTPQSVTRKLRHIRMNKPFRTEFQYNNQMYTTASYLVEKVTNTPFYNFLRSRFWTRLSMSRTFGGVADLPGGTVPSDELSWSTQHNIALGHYFDPTTSQYKRLPYFNEPQGQGAGNIISTAPDFAKWIRSMMHHTNALSSDTIHELIKPRIVSSDIDNNKGDKKEPLHSSQFYCMGWHAEYYRGHKVVYHSGGIPGFTSLMRYLPEEKFGVVLFGNSLGMGEASEVISWKLIDDFLGVPEEERMDWMRRMKAPDEDDEEREPFPNRADPPLPLPLPLEKFTGKFVHPAFGEYDFKITEDGKHLIADARDRTFGFWLRLEHVSGLHFVAYMDDMHGIEDFDEKCEAEFRVGADGVVRGLGIDFENGEESEMYWFERVEE